MFVVLNETTFAIVLLVRLQLLLKHLQVCLGLLGLFGELVFFVLKFVESSFEVVFELHLSFLVYDFELVLLSLHLHPLLLAFCINVHLATYHVLPLTSELFLGLSLLAHHSLVVPLHFLYDAAQLSGLQLMGLLLGFEVGLLLGDGFILEAQLMGDHIQGPLELAYPAQVVPMLLLDPLLSVLYFLFALCLEVFHLLEQVVYVSVFFLYFA